MAEHAINLHELCIRFQATCKVHNFAGASPDDCPVCIAYRQGVEDTWGTVHDVLVAAGIRPEKKDN